MLTLLLSNPAILAILGGIVAVIIAFFKGRVSGAAREREKHASERIKAREEADDVEDAVAGRSPEENRERLRKWGR